MKRAPLIVFLFFLCLPLSVSAKLTEQITKSPLDKRDYGYVQLENGLKVVVVSDKAAKISAAALVVHAGSFDEPDAHLGLAHFLEHMLFLGTQKYPVADEFQEYVGRHGGTYNATTQPEQTSYFFNIQPQQFDAALDRFSDFFIAPLFNEQLMDRELNSVDSEFHLNINQDTFALLEVDKETSNPNHPFSRFSAGNLKTLNNKAALYPAVKLFFEQHYHANNMTLALVGPQSKSQLLAYAKQYFSPIHSKPVVHKNRPLVFEDAQLGFDIHMRSRAQARELVIQFPIATNEQSLSKAGQLLSMLIGFEGQGSLASHFKKKKWISSLSIDYDDIAHNQDILSIHLILTPKGSKHVDDITQTIFTYIDTLKRNPFPNYFFEEVKTMSHWEFHYAIQNEPLDYALALANRLYDVPAQRLLTDNYFLKTDNLPKEALSTILNQLTDRHMRRILLSPNLATDSTTKWYQASYKKRKLTQSQLKRFGKPVHNAMLALPIKNEYLPNKLLMLQQTQDVNQPPVKLPTDGINLWYHQNTRFQLPRSNIVINIGMPNTTTSPENNLLTELYVAYAGDYLLEAFYPAVLAGADIGIYGHGNGLSVSISSYSDKQDVLLKKILSELHNIQISETDYNEMLNRRVSALKNYQHQNLFQQALSDLNTILYSPLWHPNELMQATQKISRDQLNLFASQVWQSAQIDILVHGNASKKNAIQFAHVVKEFFPNAGHKVLAKQQQKVVKLDHNKTWFSPIKSLDENQVLVWYFQHPRVNYETMAKTMLLSKILEAPYFQTLRTEQQLGYALQISPFMIDKVSGLVLWIQSSNQSSASLLVSVKAFLDKYQKSLTHLTEDEIMPYREAIVAQLRQQPLSLDEETQRLWAPIQRGDYEFDRATKLSNALEKVTAQELADFANEIFASKAIGQLLVVSTPRNKLPKDNVVPFISAFKAQKQFFATNEV